MDKNQARPIRTGPLLAVVVACVLLSSPGVADEPAQGHSKIVNGTVSHLFPTTAALLYSRNGGDATPDTAGAWCSATLIGCSTVLTAAHCIEGDQQPSHYLVFLQHAGLFEVASFVSHPQYSFPSADVAVVKLAAPVTGITPTPLNDVDPAQHLGSRGQIVGYGQSSGDAGDYGIKRTGEVVTSTCAGDPDLDDGRNVCWSFQAPIGPAGQDSNTCNGDSGGPLFLDLDGEIAVAGVTSGGSNGTCGPDDLSYDANVFHYRSFILEQLDGDSTQACGQDLPPVGTQTTTVVSRNGTFSGGGATTYTFELGAGGRSLRLVLNSEDNDAFDADLYVKRGPGVSASDNDCSAAGGSGFGACLLDSPEAGTWTALVSSTSASGQYQLTATAFGATLSADNGGGGGGGGGGGDGASCAGSCGDSPDGICWCDEQCSDYGDCCADYQAVCVDGGGGGGDECQDEVCAVDPYCCEVEWDGLCDEQASAICG